MSFALAIIFLFVALVAYTLLGGADFGAGLLEAVAPKAEREHLRQVGTHAIAPVWEANHVWIIVAVVVLFVGFPTLHVTVMTALHIPMVIMLVGIVLRGCAFAFRYYQLGASAETARPIWDAVFRVGNLLVPMAFGMICAAFSQGRITLEPASVYDAYLAPWLSGFSWATGVFVTCLFGWIAAVFLCGEVTGEARAAMERRARVWTVAMVVAGALVSLAAWLGDNPWLTGDGVWRGVWLVALGTAGVAGTWLTLSKPRPWLQRGLVGVTVTAIVGGYWLAGYPVGIVLREGPPLTWAASAAPEATLNALALALVLGSLLILPGLAWLYRIFKQPVDG